MKRNQIIKLIIFASLLFGEEVNRYKEIKYLNVALRREMEVYTIRSVDREPRRGRKGRIGL